jgi:hypothetical protein
MARALINSAPPGAEGFRRAAVAPWLKGDPLPAAPEGGNRPETQPPAGPASPTAADPAPDTSGQAAAVETARKRGRPKGSGPKQKAAAEAAAAAAEEALGGDGMVSMGSNGERVPADDALVRRFTEAYARAAVGLRAKLMGADPDEADKAEAQLQRLEAKLREIRAANKVWRRDVIERGSMSD